MPLFGRKVTAGGHAFLRSIDMSFLGHISEQMAVVQQAKMARQAEPLSVTAHVPICDNLPVAIDKALAIVLAAGPIISFIYYSSLC